jgi:regulator of replication initiation timing
MLGELIPIVGILASAAVIIQLINYLQFKQVGRDSPAEASASARENERLALENEGLKRTVGRLEERMAVLERIATDPAERTAREIESLR